jgi:hypothetical protein
VRRVLIPHDAGGPVRVAAKAGFLTKRIWVEFFNDGKLHWKYRRWQNRRWEKLMGSGLFRVAADSDLMRPVVTLTDFGKRFAVKAGINPVYAPPLKNIAHDEEMVRLALFLESQAWLSNWMTEQELKVSGKAQHFFKNEVRAQKIPDLIIEWNAGAQKVLWAIELERTRKEFTRYYEMIGAYKGISRIDLVLVITATDSIETNIIKAQAKMGYPQAQRPMLFASMTQMNEDPASCELRQGSKRITLGKMGHAITGREATKKAAQVKTSGPGQDPAWVIEKIGA